METENEEYTWPSLVDESRDLLCASILIYGMTYLRELGREGKLTGDSSSKILKVPFTAQDLLDTISDNRDTLQASYAPESEKMYATALHTLKTEDQDGAKFQEIEVIALDDEHSASELVYAISVNAAKKRVLVTFRGSVTPRDFLVDADGSFSDLDNPLNPESKEKLGIHHGFYEYLNGTPKSKSKHSTEAVNKYTEIMTQLQPIFQEHPNYRLYVTGHSLGASLSILFAVQAAASTTYSMPKPVTCINFASPKVGNVNFRDCFQSLELDKKIRCIRFVNSGDIIPTLPDRQNCNLFRLMRCQTSLYRHCGPKIILYPDGEYKVAYEKEDKETIWKFLQEVRYTFGHGIGFVMMIPALLWHKNFFLQNHGCGTYLSRFDEEFAKSKLSLSDLYEEEIETFKEKVGGKQSEKRDG